MPILPKLIAIVGPTASGKSGIAISLAQTFNGEIVSADSRQLYRGLDIGTAKDPGEWKRINGDTRYVLESGVIEHMVDILDPDQEFTAAEYQHRAFEVIDEVLGRGRVPFLVGGTGLYVQAVIDHLQFPDVAPNPELRARLEKKSLVELQNTYAACDPVGAMTIDENNKRRLIRAIEVCMVSQKPFSELQRNGVPRYEVLQLGVELYRQALYGQIDRRASEMIQHGLVEEVQELINRGVDPTKSAMTGIGYREVVDYLQGQLGFEEMIEEIQKNSRRLAKRQLTWFKRDNRIKWMTSEGEAERLVRNFLGDF